MRESIPRVEEVAGLFLWWVGCSLACWRCSAACSARLAKIFAVFCFGVEEEMRRKRAPGNRFDSQKAPALIASTFPSQHDALCSANSLIF